MARDGFDKLLRTRLHDFAALARAMLPNAADAPDRVTLGQVGFFLAVAQADLEGAPATFADFEAKAPNLGTKSLRQSCKLFLAERRSSEMGLGWLLTERSLKGNGRRQFRLTPRGREIIRNMGVGDVASAGSRIITHPRGRVIS
ncbi:conserved hypothetical protein [Novosphingobium sp. 9U]|nr:conserved hypothetical protein [Novosphingobium sp. 9U]